MPQARDDSSRQAARQSTDLRNPGEDLFRVRPGRLTRLLALDEADPRVWRQDELGAILKHQLSAPIGSDLPPSGARGSGESAGGTGPSADASGRTLETFEDLFLDPAPPVELLCQVKDFAKANWNHPASSFPSEIASLLYYESILAALVHRGQRITRLTNQELRRGVSWVLEQEWLDDHTRHVFEEGLKFLDQTDSDAVAAPEG